MKITSILLSTSTSLYTSTLAQFFLNPMYQTDPSDRNYILKSATGLDTQMVSARQYSGPLDPSVMFKPMPGPRTVVLLVGLNPFYTVGQSISALRDNLYYAVSYGGFVNLQLLNGANEVASVSGSITKFEYAPFSGVPEVQITIECDYPFLRKTDPVNVTIGGGFLTDMGGFKRGSWSGDPSTAHHGFLMELSANSGMSLVDIGVGIPGQEFRFKLDHTLLSGDHVYISSEYDDKYVRLVRPPAAPTNYTNIADGIRSGDDGVWPTMFPGGNTTLDLYSDLSVLAISYRPAYWGL